MKKILWRYPDNHPRENEAIEKAMQQGTPGIVTLVYFEKQTDFKSAAQELNMTEKAADKAIERFLLKIGDNMNLPREGKE